MLGLPELPVAALFIHVPGPLVGFEDIQPQTVSAQFLPADLIHHPDNLFPISVARFRDHDPAKFNTLSVGVEDQD